MTSVMTNEVVNELTGPWFLPFPHRALLKFAEGLTDEQLARQPSPAAPPIGWHIFHVARWADRSNRRNIVAGSVFIWSFMTAVSGFAQNYIQLLLARKRNSATSGSSLTAAIVSCS